MKYLLIVKGDTNDADYIHRVTRLDDTDKYDKEILELLPIISEALKNCKSSHNWPNSDYCDETHEEIYADTLTRDQIDIFDEYCPHSGNDQIHSISSVKLFEIGSIKEYF